MAEESLIHELFRGFEKCTGDDVEPALSFFAPDVVFYMYGPHETPITGRQQLHAAFKETFSILKSFQVEVISVARAGNKIFVERIERMLYAGVQAVTLYQVGVGEVGSDNKFTSWKDYFDPVEIKKAAGGNYKA
jgi:limonene-1,2-epoxide hydrolase